MSPAFPESAPRPSFPLTKLAYELPETLIAERPHPQRDGARLLVLDRATGRRQDARIIDLPSLLQPNDILVLNDTKVLAARFHARRRSGGKVPGLFVEEESRGSWRVMLEGSRKLKLGEVLEIPARTGPDPQLTLVHYHGHGQWRVDVKIAGGDGITETPETILARVGETPLPPYVCRVRRERPAEIDDTERYQTVYAKTPGAIAAPTAGLHLSDSLLQRLHERGIRTAFVTLHVGVGTFQPVQVDDLASHVMHGERFDLPARTAQAIHECRQSGGRVVAIGTTTARVLESALADSTEPPAVTAKAGVTHAFIYPPYRFRAVDLLLTNFHLPGSTLLAMVMALAGVETIRAAYRHAIEHKYRFYSYGDAMLIR